MTLDEISDWKDWRATTNYRDHSQWLKALHTYYAGIVLHGDEEGEEAHYQKPMMLYIVGRWSHTTNKGHINFRDSPNAYSGAWSKDVTRFDLEAMRSAMGY